MAVNSNKSVLQKWKKKLPMDKLNLCLRGLHVFSSKYVLRRLHILWTNITKITGGASINPYVAGKMSLSSCCERGARIQSDLIKIQLRSCCSSSATVLPVKGFLLIFYCFWHNASVKYSHSYLSRHMSSGLLHVEHLIPLVLLGLLEISFRYLVLPHVLLFNATKSPSRFLSFFFFLLCRDTLADVPGDIQM